MDTLIEKIQYLKNKHNLLLVDAKNAAKVMKLAEDLSYDVRVGQNPYLISCCRFDSNKCRVQVAVYWTARTHRDGKFTVSTALNHPTKGRTQLHRRHCTLEEVEELLRHPRAHTGKGYYRKGA